jgi:hypothetical protein
MKGRFLKKMLFMERRMKGIKANVDVDEEEREAF